MPAISARAKVLSAISTLKGSANRFRVFNLCTTIPTHKPFYYEDAYYSICQKLDILFSMFTLSFCAAGCGRPAYKGSALCATHSADPDADAKKLGEYIEQQKIIEDLSAQGLHFQEMDFSHLQLYGCDFNGAIFTNCLFNKSVMRMCFFEFSTFSSCNLSASDIQFLSFAGAILKDCSFEGSELVNTNFGGTLILNSNFSKTNLYNSRFLSANITESDFTDCNLNRTNFVNSIRENLSFKSSNTAEAIFEMEEYN